MMEVWSLENDSRSKWANFGSRDGVIKSTHKLHPVSFAKSSSSFFVEESHLLL